MEQVENTTSRAVFGYHIIVFMLIKSHSHVEYDVWVAHFIHDFNFFHKVNYAFLRYTFSAESLHSNCGSHPLCFEDFSVSASAKVIGFVIPFYVVEVYIEIKPIISKSLDEVLVCIFVQIFIVFIWERTTPLVISLARVAIIGNIEPATHSRYASGFPGLFELFFFSFQLFLLPISVCFEKHIYQIPAHLYLFLELIFFNVQHSLFFIFYILTLLCAKLLSHL